MAEEIVGGIVVAVLAAWLILIPGKLLRFLPRKWRLAGRNAVKLTIENVRKKTFGTGSCSEEYFRFVLCDLEHDAGGRDKGRVDGAFSGIEGIELVLSDRLVAASGAADEWRQTMTEDACKALDESGADVAAGRSVAEAGTELRLWFVRRDGAGTLPRRDGGRHRLENSGLREDFHEDVRAQLEAAALVAVKSFADSEVRGRRLNRGFAAVAGKLSKLLDGNAIKEPERRASLQIALGVVLAALGERESGTGRLEAAVTAYRTALKAISSKRSPLEWAKTQNNLGVALAALGERVSGTGHLKEAVNAYRATLEVFSRERSPLELATTQNNLGGALAALGERESGTGHLKEGIGHLKEAEAAFRAALAVRTREREPLEWALTQNNLGNVLVPLGELKGENGRFAEAVEAYRAALTERTRERVPLDWAMTQNNLGAALAVLGQVEDDTVHLEAAAAAFGAVLEVRTQEDEPLDWATTQMNLGNVLQALGRRESGSKRLEEAVKAYRAALEELFSQHPHRTATQNNLDVVSEIIRVRRGKGVTR